MWDRWKETVMPKTSSIRPIVSTQHRLVADRQTEQQMTAANTGRCAVKTKFKNQQ